MGAYEIERNRWMELFKQSDESTQKAATGLIERAAYLYSLCSDLEAAIGKSGVIKIHPEHPEIQKQVPAVKEYARLSEAYANIVNKLNGLLSKHQVDDDDGLGEFE
jgi:chitinase